MGKASRNRNRQEAKGKSRVGRVESFLSKAGYADLGSPLANWSRARNVLGDAVVDEITVAIQDRHHGGSKTAIYDILYRDQRTAEALLSLSYPMAKQHLFALSQESIPELVLDAGCGVGISACFLAWERPDATIYGIDLDERAVEVAKAIADKLRLENVIFDVADINEYQADHNYGLVTSCAAFRESEVWRLNVDPGFSWRHTLQEVPPTSSSLASLVQRNLDFGGNYVGFERVNLDTCAHLFKSFLHSGVLPIKSDLRAFGYRNNWLGIDDELLFVRAGRTEDDASSQLLDLLFGAVESTGFFPDLEAELQIRSESILIEGVEAAVEDSKGAGSNRLILVNCCGEEIAYMTTSRGARKILGRSRQARATYQKVRSSIEVARDVVSVRSLQADDLDALVSGFDL